MKKILPAGRIFSVALLIERRIDEIEVFLVHFLLGKAQAFAKALEMHHFALAQEFNDVVDIRIIRQAQNIVVGHACLLLCQGVP